MENMICLSAWIDACNKSKSTMHVIKYIQSVQRSPWNVLCWTIYGERGIVLVLQLNQWVPAFEIFFKVLQGSWSKNERKGPVSQKHGFWNVGLSFMIMEIYAFKLKKVKELHWQNLKKRKKKNKTKLGISFKNMNNTDLIVLLIAIRCMMLLVSINCTYSFQIVIFCE